MFGLRKRGHQYMPPVRWVDHRKKMGKYEAKIRKLNVSISLLEKEVRSLKKSINGPTETYWHPPRNGGYTPVESNDYQKESGV